MKMQLSISNLAWNKEHDNEIFALMQEYGFSGLEIAPTKIFPENPYSKLDEAKIWSEKLRKEYGFSVPSMQSIWYGKTENIFGSEDDRQKLLDYTKSAIDFASVIGCKNLVFGCPKSEPFLKKIEKREFHKDLFAFLKSGKYDGFVSIEMGLTENLSGLEDVMRYVREI